VHAVENLVEIDHTSDVLGDLEERHLFGFGPLARGDVGDNLDGTSILAHRVQVQGVALPVWHEGHQLARVSVRGGSHSLSAARPSLGRR
jgi:hypothetical protein